MPMLRGLGTFRLLALLCWVMCSHPALADTALDLDAARAFLEVAASDGDFSGVVLIAENDSIVFQQAYGFADVDLRVPLRVEHRFRLGSLTKPITASAVLMAIDRGLLTLDTRLGEWIPSCPVSWKPVKVRQLLSHSSGIVDHFGDLDEVPVEQTVGELERMLANLAPDEGLLAEPGTKYAYSNFNYVLLGAVLERVVGKPWETILKEWEFQPLGLSSMAYDDVYAIMENRVRGYARDDSLGLRNIDYDDHGAYAAGGLLSSASDLFHWSRAALTGRLFSEGLLKESLSPRLGNYGFGWQVRQFFERPIYNHTGGIDGFSSHLAHYPDLGLTVIVLSNVENDSAILCACDVAGRLFDWSWPDAPELSPQQRCGIVR